MFSINEIKKIVKKHPKVHLLIYIFRNVLHDKSKCIEILNSQTNPYVVNFHHFGELNTDKIFYIVDISEYWKKSGYCHLLRMTLLKLAYADHLGFTPIIRWPQDILYASSEMTGIIDNPYEYFFENTYVIKDEEIDSSHLVVISKDMDVKLYESDKTYLISEKEIQVLAKTIKKYLKLNKTGIELIENPVIHKFEGHRVLGVHVRKTDYAKRYNDHPVPIADESILQKTEELFESGNYDRVFIATDSVEVLEEYKSKFGAKLIFNDVLRSDNGKALHYEFVSKREKNNYLLGKEILLDVYSLSNCSGIIAGLSNVSVLARAIKYSKDDKYIEEIILENGINNNLKGFKKK